MERKEEEERWKDVEREPKRCMLTEQAGQVESRRRRTIGRLPDERASPPSNFARTALIRASKLHQTPPNSTVQYWAVNNVCM